MAERVSRDGTSARRVLPGLVATIALFWQMVWLWVNRLSLPAEIEQSLIRGEYRPVSGEEFEEIKKALEARKKDAVLNIRVNQGDLDNIKLKAKKMGVKYQTFISEILHRIATS